MPTFSNQIIDSAGSLLMAAMLVCVRNHTTLCAQLFTQGFEILGFYAEIGFAWLPEAFSHVVFFRNINIGGMQTSSLSRGQIPFMGGDHHGFGWFQPQ